MRLKHFLIALILMLSALPQAESAELSEYVADTILLPVRTAAIGSAIAVTSPIRSCRAAVSTAKLLCPDNSPDTTIFEYAAVPLGFVAGACAGPADGAGETINRAWNKPFSLESFQVEN